MINKALFQGVTTPVSDLAKAIQNQGWQLGQVQFDNKLNAYTATVISPHGDQLTKTGPDEGTAVANALLACTRRNHMRTTAQYKVGMWRTNFHERAREIAEAYRDAPIYDPKAVAAWKALGDDSMHRLHVLGGQLHIEPTNDPQPYKSADDMRKDVHEKRHYYLTQAGAAHPVWTAQQVAAFRAVHDILGHGVAGGHYDWPGRVQAAAAHFPLLEPLAQQALFTEAVARPAFLHTYGAGPQKIALFPDFVDHHQDSNNPSAHRGIHPSQTTAPVAPAEGFALLGNSRPGNDEDWEWQQGLCGTYACALIRQYPHLRFGALDGGSHFFAHDDRHAYDSLGRHPLPYLGIDESFEHQGLDEKPEWYGVPHDEAGPEGPEPHLQRAAEHIRRNNILQRDFRTAAWGNTIDANKGWDSGIDPLPTNAYIHHGDPLQYKETMDNAGLVDTNWSKMQKGDGSDDRERMKQAIVNAFRAVLLSPRKDLRWNAIHYQDISNIPGGVDDPKVYWDTLENARRRWNEKQGIDPEAHMIYYKFLKPFEARIAANHPEKGWEWAKNEAKQVLFDWWTEEQERIQEEDAKKPADKQRFADEIERRANEALARRLQLFLKPKDEKTDVEDGQLSMLGSIHDLVRIADFDYDKLIQKNVEGWDQYNDLEGGKADVVGWVPTEEVAKFAEYDRKPGGRDHMHFPGYWEALRSHIQQNGFKSPLYIDVNQDTGTGHLSEGNHRIQIAQELGIPHVPVIMYRSRRKSPAERPLNIDITQFPEDRFDPAGYRMPHMFHPAIAGLPTREPYSGHKVAAGGQFNLLTGEEGLKYGAFMGTHLKAIAQISQHADEILDAALEDVRGHDAEGHHFRHKVLQLGVSGVGPKVCSFAWLLLQPLTSQLATIDVHMMDVLGHDYEKEMNNRDYFKFEREFRAGLDAAGYSHLPLGAGQWGMWDYKRTGPGSHQDHSAMRVLDPKPHNEVDWAAKVQPIGGGLATDFKKKWADSIDWWANTKPAREKVGQEWDATYGKQFPRNQIPYQGIGSQVTAKLSYDNPFSYYWDRSMPVGSSLDSKARTLAEHAKADDMSDNEFEDWLEDHKSDTRLSSEAFKRFKKKALRKFERLSRVSVHDTGPTPSFIHPETLTPYHGMPGQALMEHARLQTGLSTQDVWRLLGDEHVHKSV